MDAPLSRSFRGFAGVSVDLFPNNTFRGFVEISMEGRLQVEVFRPERLVHKGPRRPQYYGGVTLPLVAIRFEPVSSAECQEQTSLPLVGQRKLRLRQGLCSDCAIERLPHALHRRRGGLTFARGRGALE